MFSNHKGPSNNTIRTLVFYVGIHISAWGQVLWKMLRPLLYENGPSKLKQCSTLLDTSSTWVLATADQSGK